MRIIGKLPAGMRSVPLVYVVLSVLLWPVPLLGLLHAESTALVAATAFFAAGLSSVSLFRSGYRVHSVLALQLGALIIPLVLLTVTLIWRPNCGYVDGLMFFGLFPVVTVVFAVALAYSLDRWAVRRPRGWLAAVGILVSLLGPIYDIGFHPQFYTYNHVFGGILGPIYDEELAVRPGLFVFRGVTLAWATFFILVGRIGEYRRGAEPRVRTTRRHAAALTTTGGILALSYIFAADLGLNTTTADLKDALGGHHATDHFDIYFDPETVSDGDLQVIADVHEFRYNELARSLDVWIDERIQSFIYPDQEVKASLTGARYTNVAPVWLSIPQTHVLQNEFIRVFPHEVVHVFSREFGLPVLNASLAVGLVEGLAVALEPADGLPTPHEQVSAALLSGIYEDGHRSDDPRSEADALAAAVAARLSPMGFWAGRGAVSYTTMGSFVRYLLDAYGVEPMKNVYAFGDFQGVYGKPVERLAAEWTESLLNLRLVASSSAPLVAARFAVPSLLEKRCPHHVPPHRREYRRAATLLARGDSAAALQATASSLDREPRYLPSLDLWARLMLARGDEEAVRTRIEPLTSDSLSASLLVRLGDSRALMGDSAGARTAYDVALDRLPSFAHEDAARIHLRRAVACRPDVMRTLAGGRGRPPGDDPPAAIARALYHERVGQYEQAADLLRTTFVLSDDMPSGSHLDRHAIDVLHRRRLVWLARFHFRAGALSTAAAYAEQAADAYRVEGAFNEAARLFDFHRMMLWLASSSTATTNIEALSQSGSK